MIFKGLFCPFVVADDCNMLTAFDLDIDMLKQGKRAKVFGEIFNRKNIISADDLRRQLQMHIIPDLNRFF